MSRSAPAVDQGLHALTESLRQQRWQAILDATQAASLVPDRAHLLQLSYRGVALLQLGRLEEAHRCLQLAHRRSPSDGRISFFLGRTLVGLGEVRRALPHLRQAHRQIPLQETSAAAFWYISALQQLGDRDAAAYVRAAALAVHPDDPLLLGLQPHRHAPQSPRSTPPSDALLEGGSPTAAAGSAPGSWDTLLLIDPSTVLCTGQLPRSLQPSGGSILQLRFSPAAQPPVVLQLQGLVTQPSTDRDGHRFWARFQRPAVSGEQASPLEQSGRFDLRIGLERCSPGRVIDIRDQPWPQAAEACLAALRLETVPFASARRWLDAVIGPAIANLHHQVMQVREQQSAPAATRCLQFGSSAGGGAADPIPPEVSLLIPLYRRWDFMRAQIAAFALDPGINNGRVQVLYVCDDPSIEPELVHWCQSQGHHAGLPFELLLQPRNQGFAASINLAARRAKGGMLCLFNSDVLPCAPGWLAELLMAWRQHPDVAITTGLLLYPDGSVQHAGMELISNPAFPDFRLNHHPGKGLDWHGGDQPQPISLCSGALMLLERREFLDLGGSRQDFIRGDFEDSDLCLRLQQRGRRCLLVPRARLWHGERQSMPGRAAQVDLLHHWQVLTNAWLASAPPDPVPA